MKLIENTKINLDGITTLWYICNKEINKHIKHSDCVNIINTMNINVTTLQNEARILLIRKGITT